MKSNAILNRIGCCLIIILSVFNSSAQPDYLSKEYSTWQSFYDIIAYDSGYFASKSPRIIEFNFEGDTMINSIISFGKPGNHDFKMYKASQNIIYCIGYTYNNSYTNTAFCAKLNYNLDTLWVKYYDTLVYGYCVSTVVNDTAIIAYLGTSDKINTLIIDNNGVIIEHRMLPKYPGSLSPRIRNIAAVNTKVFAIALEILYKSSWDQNYYYKPMICVSDTNGYYYFESGFEYILGSGTSQSFIFYDKASNRIKHFYHFAQMDNFVNLYEHTLSGQLITSKGIYFDDAYVTGEIWYPRDITMLESGCFVICGKYEEVYQGIKGGFIMRCGLHGEWNWFRKYKELQSTASSKGLHSIVETNNQFLASAGQGSKAWLLVVDSLGCEAPGVCWVGEEEISSPLQENLLEIYPNPAGEEVWVKSAAPLAGLTIYAMNGQKMPMAALSGENPMRIDTRTWPAGLYVVRATLQNGRVAMQKVMKCR